MPNPKVQTAIKDKDKDKLRKSSLSKSNPELDEKLMEDVLLSSSKKRHRGGFMGTLSNGFGRVLNQLVSAGMKTPIVKYLLNPQTLKKALNGDPILRETYRIILTSEPVQNLMTPEAMKIIVDSETAKKVITPELVLSLLNHDIAVQFATKEVVKFLLESEVLQKVLTPEAILNNMESRFAQALLRPEIIHEIAYSTLFTRWMDADFFVNFFETSGVKAVMTKEAIADVLASPAARGILVPETVDKVLGVQGVQNLLEHEEFRKHLIMAFGKAMKNEGGGGLIGQTELNHFQ